MFNTPPYDKVYFGKPVPDAANISRVEAALVLEKMFPATL